MNIIYNRGGFSPPLVLDNNNILRLVIITSSYYI
jgi:hypothetical protein